MNIFSSLLNWSKADAPVAAKLPQELPPFRALEDDEFYVCEVRVLRTARYSGYTVHVIGEFDVADVEFAIITYDEKQDYETQVVRAALLQAIPDYE